MSLCKTYFNLLILGCLYKSTKKLLKCFSWVRTIPLILSRSILSMLTLQTKYVTLLTSSLLLYFRTRAAQIINFPHKGIYWDASLNQITLQPQSTDPIGLHKVLVTGYLLSFKNVLETAEIA